MKQGLHTNQIHNGIHGGKHHCLALHQDQGATRRLHRPSVTNHRRQNLHRILSRHGRGFLPRHHQLSAARPQRQITRHTAQIHTVGLLDQRLLRVS